jgi:hypothetical protein
MSSAAVFTGIELLIQLIDRAAAASSIIKTARAEGRDVTSAELAQLRAEGDASMAALDDAIARAKSEGR